MTNVILAVCSGNVCRSPFAVAVLDGALAGHGLGGRITLRSRGEQADPGRPVCAQALRTAQRRGLPSRLIDEHRASALDAAELSAADLVLAADRSVRAAVLKLDPRAAERTFTFREATALARLVEVDDDDRPRDLAGFARALNDNRGLTELPALERTLTLPWYRLRVHAHDVPDAHADRHVSHRVVYRTLVPAVEELVARLAAFASVRQR